MPGPSSWSEFGKILPHALGQTLSITLWSSLLGVILGLVLVVLRLVPVRSVAIPARLLIDLGRGLPTLPFLFLVYFAVGALGFPLSPERAGTLALGVFLGFYMAEVFRSGIQSVPAGHVEAALALGLSRPKVWRRVLLPEGLRPMVPAVGQLVVGNMINSSFVSVIGGNELTGATRDVIDTYFQVNLWWVLAGVYFVIAFPISRLLAVLEKRWTVG